MIAIFIPNLKCAEFVLKEKFYLRNNHILFTNNLSVFSFFNDLKKIKCLNMNSYIERNKLNNLFIKTYYRFLKNLKKVDNDKNFENFFDVKLRINWLFSLYRYKSLLAYTGLKFYEINLKKFLKKKKISSLVIFKEFPPNEILLNEDYIDITRQIAKNLKVKFYINDFCKQKNNFNLKAFENLLKLFLKYLINFCKNQSIKIKSFSSNKSDNIGIFEPLYELKYINFSKKNKFIIYQDADEKLKKIFYNIKYFNKDKFVDRKLINELIIKYSYDYIVKKILNRIFLDLEKNLYFYEQNCIKKLDYLKKNQIKKIYWGLPPVNPNLRTALISYLKMEGIEVCGVQHGGSYGVQPACNSIHVLSDYSNCDKFLSYHNYSFKHSNKHSKKLFKKKDICKIQKKGSYKSKFFNRSFFNHPTDKKILYAIGQGYSSFTGFIGLDTTYIYNLQKKILNILDENKKIKKIVKLTPPSSRKIDDSFYPGAILLKKYNDLIFEEKKTFINSIKYYNPDLIILDTFSTTIDESINSKSEIICFLDDLIPPNKTILKKLSKRIHFVNSIREFNFLFKKYCQNSLEKKI